MRKFFLFTLLSLVTGVHLLASDLSLSLSESIRSPLDSSKPLDYQITFQTRYADNLDIYYLQERNEGLTEREYWVALQRNVWKSIWLAGKRQDSKDNDLWLADLKCNIEASGWKTFIGYSNCWEGGIYKPKLLLEEQKSFNFDFFLTPFELNTYLKLLADTKKLYHEEKIDLRFLINLPTSWKLSKYINTYIKLFVLSKDYGYYRWQQKLMLEVNFK
jgi:hypothetical protein